MERVAFLVDRTGERIECLLNPETVEVRRSAGVRRHTSASGQLVGAGLSDDPLLFTGGGRTELELELMFSVDLIETSVAPDDVTPPPWVCSSPATPRSTSSWSAIPNICSKRHPKRASSIPTTSWS